MTLKTLVTGAAAAVVVAGAAAGVTSIASPDVLTTPARYAGRVGHPDAAGARAGPAGLRCFRRCRRSARPGLSASKAPYIEGGIGRIEGRVADSKLRDAQAEGKFPLSFTLANIDRTVPGDRRRHRDGRERRRRQPEHRVRSRSQPHRLADVESSR